jgi:hypothetical protein
MNIALYVVLGLSALLDLTLGAWASVYWESFAARWHLAGLVESPEARLMGAVLGLCLICFAALQLLAGWWIRSEKEEGHRVVILFGIYLMVSSILTFVFFHRTEFLLVDGLRGAALTVLAVVALNAPPTVKALRLPVRSGEGERPRRSERPREHSRGRRPGGTARVEGESSARFDRSRSGSSPDRGDGRDGRESGEGRRRRDPRERGGRRDRPSRTMRAEPRDRPVAEDRSGSSRDRLRPVVANVPEARLESRIPAVEETASRELSGPVRGGEVARDDRPLTVVVKGGPEGLRGRASEDAEVPAAPEVAVRESEAAGSSSERRRRRRRRPRGGISTESRTELGRIEDERFDSKANEPVPVKTEPEAAPKSREEAIEERIRNLRARRQSARAQRGEVVREAVQVPVRETNRPSIAPASDPSPEPEAEPERVDAPPVHRSSTEVEALDMLGLIESPERDAARASQPFGRTRKPVRGYRPPSAVSRVPATAAPTTSPSPAQAAPRPEPTEGEDARPTPPPTAPPARPSEEWEAEERRDSED